MNKQKKEVWYLATDTDSGICVSLYTTEDDMLLGLLGFLDVYREDISEPTFVDSYKPGTPEWRNAVRDLGSQMSEDGSIGCDSYTTGSDDLIF